jgi:hypothetical protein
MAESAGVDLSDALRDLQSAVIEAYPKSESAKIYPGQVSAAAKQIEAAVAARRQRASRDPNSPRRQAVHPEGSGRRFSLVSAGRGEGQDTEAGQNLCFGIYPSDVISRFLADIPTCISVGEPR